MSLITTLALALAASGEVAGQVSRDTVQLEPIVVTATGLPTAVGRVTAPVTVITGAQLRAQGIRYVLDALRAVPGAMIVQTGSFGGTASLFLRGGESDYVRVLVDGVPINQPGGALNLAALTTDNVDRIEVVRGPASVLYGSDAMTGVVQIFTRRAGAGLQASIGVRSGSLSTHALEVGATMGGGPLSASFGGALEGSGGLYRVNNGFRNTTLSGLVGVAVGRTEARAALRYGAAEYHFPTDGIGRVVDVDQFQRDFGTSVAVELAHRITDRVEARAQVSLARGLNRFYDADPSGPFLPTEVRSRILDQRRRVDVRANVRVGAGTVVTAGLVREAQREESDFFLRRLDVPGVFSSDESGFRRSNTAVYGQVLSDIAGRLSLALGLRREDNQVFGGFTTYRVGGAYRLDADTRLRAAVGTGFKEPTFFENFATGFADGNPSLRPERSFSWELGVERSLWGRRADVQATLFHQRFRDLIEYTPNPSGPDFDNVAAAIAAGLEVETLARLGRSVTATLRYTWLHTEVTDSSREFGTATTFVLGRPLLRRPTHSASLQLATPLGSQGVVSATVMHVGRRDDLDFGTFPFARVALGAYTRVDGGVELEVVRPMRGSAGFTGTIRVENLLNARYEEARYFPARGRVVFVGGRLTAGL